MLKNKNHENITNIWIFFGIFFKALFLIIFFFINSFILIIVQYKINLNIKFIKKKCLLYFFQFIIYQVMA